MTKGKCEVNLRENAGVKMRMMTRVMICNGEVETESEDEVECNGEHGSQNEGEWEGEGEDIVRISVKVNV